MIHAARSLIAFTVISFATILFPTPSIAQTFTFEDYFQGKTVAYGKFSAINGVKRTFRVDLNGTWNGKTLKLVEKFVYDDGIRETKIWYFTKTAEGKYIGKRSDVKGIANVSIRGNTARYGYELYLDAKNRKNLVQFKDKRGLRRDGTVKNTATVSKFGIPVGKVVVNFARAADESKLKKP